MSSDKKAVVFLTGHDRWGWALDEDARIVQSLLEETVEFTDDIQRADVVHTVWWEPVTQIPDQQLSGKRIVCHIPAEPYRYLTIPEHRHAIPKVSLWVTRSVQAENQLKRMNLPVKLIPYVVDLGLFYPIDPDTPEIEELRRKWNIPTDKYIIGNFHRDSEGSNVLQPKLVKGPDIFVEMMRVLVENGHPIHVLLAGPRRHWVRKKLLEYNVPFTYVGETMERDDIKVNILSRSELNQLYALCNLYVVSSRSEGGPQSTMECGAAKCKIVSTRVGLADDILDARSIFDDVAQGVEIIVKDLQADYLAGTIAPQYERVTAHHSTESIRDKLQSIYSDWRSLPVYQSQPVVRKQKTRLQRRFEKALRLIMPNRSIKFSVGLWHKFFKPPYGGGNQFLLALRKSLQGRGIHIVENELGMGIDSYVLNSVHFDIEKFSRAHKKDTLPIVHRIDGPISLIRGFDKEKDDLAFELNQKLASSTVLQSFWSYERILEMGYRPVKPVIVHNAVDPDIFHSNNRISFDRTRKIRIISSSWSDNPRKGGAIYKWIEENLDWERFDYTFVGRASEKFNRIHQIEPVSSAELAGLLRQHDIYITASQNDPCSNALIEALACGLPALYLNDGGHPELVQFGGLPFSGTQDVLQQLNRIVDHYELFQRIISIPTMDSVANIYLSLLRDAANGKS